MSGHDDQARRPAVMTVKDARSLVGAEIRRLDDVLGSMPEPTRMDVLLAQAPLHPELLQEQLGERLLAMRQPSLDARHEIARRNPRFAAGDLAFLGLGYMARRAQHRRQLQEADGRIQEDEDRFRPGTPEARRLLHELASQTEIERQQTRHYASVAARRGELRAALKAVSNADARDIVGPAGMDLDTVAAAMHARGPDLAACARLRVWLEALERCGVSPRVNSPDPGGLGRSPLERILRQEIASLPGTTPGPLQMLDTPMARGVRQLVPSDSVRQAMDAIAALRSQGLVSQGLVQGAAGAIVEGIGPHELPALFADFLAARGSELMHGPVVGRG